MKFYNRVNELSIIRENEKQSYDSAVFMVLTGRRRVGKTSLVTKAMEVKNMPICLCQKALNRCFARISSESLNSKSDSQCMAKSHDLKTCLR